MAAIFLTMFLAGNMFSLPASGSELEKPAFTREEQAYIQESAPLKVGYVCDRKPVSFQGEDGQLAGISRDIFDRIAEISGLKFDYVELPVENVTYDYLAGEHFDLVTSVEYNKENQAARGILMSDPYLSSRKVIVVRDGLKFDKNAHFTVAISTGSQTIKKVIGAQYPNFKIVDYPSIEACLDAVNEGKADLMIQNQYVVEYWLHKPGYSSLVVIPMLEMADQLCFSAVVPLEDMGEDTKEWREKEKLISVINKSIACIPEGEVSGYIIEATLKNQYKFTFSDFLYQYRYTAAVLGVAFVLICVLVYAALHARLRSVNARADAKAKGDFLSAMSHEIRTPLNGLISLNYLMSQNVNDQEKIENYLKQSSTVSKYLLSLVNNVLDMSRLQDGEMELLREPVDLRLLLTTVESVAKAGMEEKKIDFSIDAQLPYPGIIGDTGRIQQVLINLLDNARKFTEEGGSVTVKVRQEEDQYKDVLTRIEVSDTGCGISEEFQKKIFTPFTQERDTVSKGNQGTGLGLSICALLAKHMGGSLTVESKMKEGSRFIFEFPAKKAQLSKESGTDVSKKEEQPHAKIHVLVAEDNELNGQILTELLEGEGFQVSLVENGRQAVDAFAASAVGEYNVILMDLLMPEMDGFEASRTIRAMDRADSGTIRIFASTANTMQADRERAFASGMNDFIAKPINIAKLVQKLEKQETE